MDAFKPISLATCGRRLPKSVSEDAIGASRSISISKVAQSSADQVFVRTSISIVEEAFEASMPSSPVR